MSGYHIVIVQANAAAHAAASAQPSPEAVDAGSGTASLDRLPETIRRSVEEATRGLIQTDAVQHELQQAVREAQQHVRDAEQHLRIARTDDQRGTAQRQMSAARQELAVLQKLTEGGTYTVQLPRSSDDIIPPQLVDISIAFFIMMAVIIIGWPLARAFGRRLEKRAGAPALPDPAIAGQLQRIEQAVEAMSIEIERISESQRFMAKLQSNATERPPLSAGERR